VLKESLADSRNSGVHRASFGGPCVALLLSIWSAPLWAGLGCASTPELTQQPGEPRFQIVRDPEPELEARGIPPDIQAEILLLLEQRDSTTSRCYHEELNVRGDRSFQGDVDLLIEFAASGAVTDVKVVRSTLDSAEVANCVMAAIQQFEYPEIGQPGEIKYSYHFRPAY